MELEDDDLEDIGMNVENLQVNEVENENEEDDNWRSNSSEAVSDMTQPIRQLAGVAYINPYGGGALEVGGIIIDDEGENENVAWEGKGKGKWKWKWKRKHTGSITWNHVPPH